MEANKTEMEQYAEALNALGAAERIEILDFLREEEEATVEDLSEYMEDEGYDNASISLVHNHLPLLDSYDAIDYDENEVSYNGHDVMEEVIGTLEQMD